MRGQSLTILFHNYYGDEERWLKQMLTLDGNGMTILHNRVEGSIYGMLSSETDVNRQSALWDIQRGIDYREFRSTNVGKDIGGKLLLVDAAKRIGDVNDYWLFFHDKVSPYHALGNLWSERLLRILSRAFCEAAIGVFKRKPSVGIVCLKNTIQTADADECAVVLKDTVDASLLEDIISSGPKLPYVAGTMFMARAELFRTFRWQVPPLSIRTVLEAGDVNHINQMTVTHAWERMWTWIVTYQGYSIETI